MNTMAALAVSAALAFTAMVADAGTRSAAARNEFKRHNPCPANGKRSGACPGYVIDHVIPLCAGGPDHPSNMQWQTVADALEKDKQERKLCRDLKRSRIHPTIFKTAA